MTAVRAEIIAIGSELLLGGVADTNSLFLADAPDFMREVRAFDALSKETPR